MAKVIEVEKAECHMDCGELFSETSTIIPRYTLDDFRALATEYADEHHNEARLAIQQMTKRWLEWVERKEQSNGRR